MPGIWDREYVGTRHPVWRRIMDNDEFFVCYKPPQAFPVPVPKVLGQEGCQVQRLSIGFPIQRKTLEPLVTAKFTFAVYGRIF